MLLRGMAARGCGQPEGRRSRQRKGAAWCHAQGTEGPCFLLQAQLPQDEHLDRHLGAFPPHPALSCQGSQELRGDGHAAGSAHLSRLWSFQMMHPTENVLSNLRDPEKLLTLLSLNSLPILWLVLRALVMLSETSQMVSRTLPNKALLAAWCWDRRQHHGLSLAGSQEVG